MLSVGTKWTNITRRVMDKSMPDHFILPLETFAAFTSRTSLHVAVMRTNRRMDVGM